MNAQPEISMLDLRRRSQEILDAVEGGQAFTVTRNGSQIGELAPRRRRQQFVPRLAFAQAYRTAPTIDLARFRAGLDAAYDADEGKP